MVFTFEIKGKQMIFVLGNIVMDQPIWLSEFIWTSERNWN